MYEKILVPLDGSKVGEAALPVIEELVSKLSPKLKIEVTLLQVISSVTHWVVAGGTSTPVEYSEPEMNLIKQNAKAYLVKAGEGLAVPGATVNTEIRVGNAAEEIIKLAEETGADLIAMSTHGRSGISRWALGSITDRIVRSGHKPVLVVRAAK